MASMLGYEGSVWLVVALLVLTLGLAGALVSATRLGGQPTPARDRHPH
jgi:hypothetical protein